MSHYYSKYSNAGILLTTRKYEKKSGKEKERLLVLRDISTGKWGIPFGRKEGKDHDSKFKTMQREFKEEVGFKLPHIGTKKEYKTFTACANSITFFKCLGPHKYDKIQNMTKDGWKLKHHKAEHDMGYLLNVENIKWRKDSAHFYIKGVKQEFRKEAYKSLNKAKALELFSSI
jgi:8-oxo-dGTP pyrophosphatase MutT (NUDIX family)